MKFIITTTDRVCPGGQERIKYTIMSEKKTPSHTKQEKPASAKTPQPVKTEGKSLKRKLFGSGAISEDESPVSDKKPAVKRRKSNTDCSPTPGTTTPKSVGSLAARRTPMSERQQMVLLKQMTAESQQPGDTSPRPSSPHTPSSAIKKTPRDPVHKRNEKGETPLHIAAIRGDCKQAKKLIKAGAEVNVKDFAGWTPLHEACSHGHVPVAKHLLRAGANVNVQGLENDTPLHDASCNGHQKLVELLLKHGANPVQTNSRGKSPLDVAANGDILRVLKREIIASSSDSSSVDGTRSPTSPESNNSDPEDILKQESQDVPVKKGRKTSYCFLKPTKCVKWVKRKDPGLISSLSSGISSTSQLPPGVPICKRLHGSHLAKIVDKSPRLTLKFQHIKSTTERTAEPAYPSPSQRSYSVTVDTGEVFDPYSTRSPFSPAGSTTSSQDSELYDPHLEVSELAKRTDTVTSVQEKVAYSPSSTNPVIEGKDVREADSVAQVPSGSNIKLTSSASELPLLTQETGRFSHFEDISDTEGDASEEQMDADTPRTIPDPKSTSSSNIPETSSSQPKFFISHKVGSRDSKGTGTYTSSSSVVTQSEGHVTKLDRVRQRESHHKLPSSPFSYKSDDSGSEKELKWSPKVDKEKISPKDSRSSPKVDTVSSGKESPVTASKESASPKSDHDTTKTPTLDKVMCDKSDWDKNGSKTERTEGEENKSPLIEKEVPTVTSSTDDLNKETPELDIEGKLSPRSDTKERPSSPKVPPLKIIIPANNPVNNGGGDGENLKKLLMKPALPYVLNPTQEGLGQGDGSGVLPPELPAELPVQEAKPQSTSRHSSRASSTVSEIDKNQDVNEAQSEASSTTSSKKDKRDGGSDSGKEKEGKEAGEQKEEKEERRMTRSAFRTAQQQQAIPEPVTAEKDKEVASTNGNKRENTSTEDVNMLPPKRRKLRPRPEPAPLQQNLENHPPLPPPQHLEKPENPYELFLSIRKQIEQRRKGMSVVQPKPPQGFKDYLMNSCKYVLQGNSASRLAVPMLSPPNSLTGPMRELFEHQEKSRYKLRLQHVIERQKLMLSMEQEYVREHGRAARAQLNQFLPLSVCSILRDEEIYNTLDGDQVGSTLPITELPDDKDKRSRYNGRQFLSWLADVDDKFEKIKEKLLSRHHHEAESLQAVQKMEWEWKLRDLGQCDRKTKPVIEEVYVPMVQVNDEFDLLPT